MSGGGRGAARVERRGPEIVAAARTELVRVMASGPRRNRLHAIAVAPLGRADDAPSWRPSWRRRRTRTWTRIWALGRLSSQAAPAADRAQAVTRLEEIAGRKEHARLASRARQIPRRCGRRARPGVDRGGPAFGRRLRAPGGGRRAGRARASEPGRPGARGPNPSVRTRGACRLARRREAGRSSSLTPGRAARKLRRSDDHPPAPFRRSAVPRYRLDGLYQRHPHGRPDRATREVSGVFDTIADYELARYAASAGLVQFEGMHQRSPEQRRRPLPPDPGLDGLRLCFPQEDYKDAVDATTRTGRVPEEARHGRLRPRRSSSGSSSSRTTTGLRGRARRTTILSRSGCTTTSASKDDAANLFWPGYAWIARSNLDKDQPEYVANLYVAHRPDRSLGHHRPDARALERVDGPRPATTRARRRDRPEQADVRHGPREDAEEKPHRPGHLRHDLRLREGRPRALRAAPERGHLRAGPRPRAAARQPHRRRTPSGPSASSG